MEQRRRVSIRKDEKNDTVIVEHVVENTMSRDEVAEEVARLKARRQSYQQAIQDIDERLAALRQAAGLNHQ